MAKQVVKTVVQGEVNTRQWFNVKYRNSSGVVVPFDLTGYTVTINIYDVTRTTLLVNGGTISVTDPVNGVCYFSTTSASSATVARSLGRLIMSLSGIVAKTREFQWIVEATA